MMCGICVLITSDANAQAAGIDGCCDHLLNRRGPDASSHQKVCLNQSTVAHFHGYTLHFRGNLTPQPVQHSNGDLLLWNGEIFGGISVDPGQNDGHVLLLMLAACSTDAEILNTLSQIQGPWAFAYLQKSSKRLWFGRDLFGRRSLLFYVNEEGSLFGLSSVLVNTMKPWIEVPASGVFCAQLTQCNSCIATAAVIEQITLYPWAKPIGPSSSVTVGVVDMSKCHVLNQTLPQSSAWGTIPVQVSNQGVMSCIEQFNESIPEVCESICQSTECISGDILSVLGPDSCMLEVADNLLTVLGEAVRIRVQCQSHWCSLCIQQRLTSAPHCDPADTNSDITTSGTRDQCLFCHQLSNHTGAMPCSDSKTLPKPRNVADDVMETDCTAMPASWMKPTSTICQHARVAVLYSGGIDSLVIAALADRYLPTSEPIDLINVAFEQRLKHPQCNKNCREAMAKTKVTDDDPYGVPDRLTGLQGLEQLSPDRAWNFIQVNISLKELQDTRSRCVAPLVYPSNTVLDDSIGCAVWFAARGQGIITKADGTSHPYTSTARVVLLGMGADEQLGGYSRHRVKYSNQGWAGLIQEIQMEIGRISSRNLGRDDRIISDHAREARLPFLDESVVSFLNSLPMCKKVNFDLPRGYGEKLLLRLAAAKLGLSKSATLPKRAIQFGSRIAKLENRKEKASNVCDRLEDT